MTFNNVALFTFSIYLTLNSCYSLIPENCKHTLKYCYHHENNLQYRNTCPSCISFINIAHYLECLCRSERNRVSVYTNSMDKHTGNTQTSLALVPYDESSLPVFHKEERTFQFGDQDIKIKQNWQESGVAAVVWDAAVVLCEYLYKHPQEVKGKKVIELGAGTGIAGILAAFIGAEVTLTDRGLALQNLRSNVELNVNTNSKPGKSDLPVKVKELSWGENLEEYKNIHYDVILGADIIYIEETFPLLLQTLETLATCKTRILISCKIRYERDETFLNMMKKKFELTEILYDKARDIHIYLATVNQNT